VRVAAWALVAVCLAGIAMPVGQAVLGARAVARMCERLAEYELVRDDHTVDKVFIWK